MKAKLMINDVEIEVEVSEEEFKKLNKPSKKNGHERVSYNKTYYLVTERGTVRTSNDVGACDDDSCYGTANYYSSKAVAENNARADELMRKLRRFAVEHRETDTAWNNIYQTKYSIIYDHLVSELIVDRHYYEQSLCIYFDSMETAQRAIDLFHEDLIWYFTEYKDSCSEDDSNEN